MKTLEGDRSRISVTCYVIGTSYPARTYTAVIPSNAVIKYAREHGISRNMVSVAVAPINYRGKKAR